MIIRFCIDCAAALGWKLQTKVRSEFKSIAIIFFFSFSSFLSCLFLPCFYFSSSFPFHLFLFCTLLSSPTFSLILLPEMLLPASHPSQPPVAVLFSPQGSIQSFRAVSNSRICIYSVAHDMMLHGIWMVCKW